PIPFGRRDPRKHASRIVERQRQEVISSERDHLVPLDLCPRHKAECARREAEPAQIEDEWHAAGEQPFGGDARAESKEGDSEPSDYAIDDVGIVRGEIPRGGYENAAGDDEGELLPR